MSDIATVSYSHVQMYVDKLRDLVEYKNLERKLNAFAKTKGGPSREAWLRLQQTHGDPVTGCVAPEAYKIHGQDVVEQMMVGLGWRVTGINKNSDTTTVLLTSPDASGVKFLVTAHNKLDMQALGDEPAAKRARAAESDTPDHFRASKVANFAASRKGRQAIAVLGFKTPKGGVEMIRKKYAALHPKLLLPGTPLTYGDVKVLEVYAYYKGDKCVTDADPGAIIRFVEGADTRMGQWWFPGLEKVDADFDDTTASAFSDHWVSNVISRTGFVETMEECLGFSAKVDFNAGVVAAGEVQIESTVTGNSPEVLIPDTKTALVDQSQVYLPTNNPLSEVGHVHTYIQELGQGVQHLASRVGDLPTVVQRANDYRKMTGAGFTFLSIPLAYYGSLTAKGLSKDANIDIQKAATYVEALHKAGIVNSEDIIDFDVTRERLQQALPAGVGGNVIDMVLRARYRNLYALLRDHISDEIYLKIVRNNILIDVQGDDLLMQIFTATVLMRNPGEEAPFIELIQRICSEKIDPSTGKPKPLKPGCGGFGIRNFLTLFLSIEVTKATKGKADSLKSGNKAALEYYQKQVDAYTHQLEESGPILTALADAMTAEGDARDHGDKVAEVKQAAEKAKAGEDLKACSMKYKDILKTLRENAPAGV